MIMRLKSLKESFKRCLIVLKMLKTVRLLKLRLIKSKRNKLNKSKKNLSLVFPSKMLTNSRLLVSLRRELVKKLESHQFRMKKA
jgi:hypothetical protein